MSRLGNVSEDVVVFACNDTSTCKMTLGHVCRPEDTLVYVRLVKLAMVDGFALHQTAVKDSWQHYLGDFLHGHLGQQQLLHNFDIASVIERAKHQHAFEHSSLMLYRTMQPEYKSAEYLSVVKCAPNRRLISRFRTGCHGLRVDTGRWADGVHLDRTDRLCLVCKALDYVEDEQHFVFD